MSHHEKQAWKKHYFHSLWIFFSFFVGFFVFLFFFSGPWNLYCFHWDIRKSGQIIARIILTSLLLTYCLILLMKFAQQFHDYQNPIFLNGQLMLLFLIFHFLSNIVRDFLALMLDRSDFWNLSIKFTILFVMAFSIIQSLQTESNSFISRKKKFEMIIFGIFCTSLILAYILDFLNFLEDLWLYRNIMIVGMIGLFGIFTIYRPLFFIAREKVSPEKNNTLKYPQVCYVYSIIFGLAILSSELSNLIGIQNEYWISIPLSFILILGLGCYAKKVNLLAQTSVNTGNLGRTGYLFINDRDS